VRPSSKLALLLDEMFSPAIAEELRRRGHDVVAVAGDPRLQSMTDTEVFGWAKTDGRRVVTENVADFRPLLFDDPQSPGVLFTSSRSLPRRRRSMGALIAALDGWLVTAKQQPLAAEAWLSPPSRSR